VKTCQLLHNSTNESWLTAADRATRCVTTSRRRAVRSTGDGRRSSVELTTLGNDRRAVAKLFLAQKLGKSSRGNCAYFGDIRISDLFDKYSAALSPRPEALDQVEARSQTLYIDSKSHARNECIDLPP